jgi:ammonium transporter, Amt family
MKSFFKTLTLSLGLFAASMSASAQDAAKPALKEPTPEERIADLEAYVNNGARVTTAEHAGKVTGPGPGHNAWMMTSAALVLFMTLPGLALFYGGLVRKKNMLSVIAQCFGIAGLVTIMWVLFGYSAVFAAGSPYLGSLSKFAFLKDVTAAPNTDYAAWVSQNILSMYQMMFAIITPALIVGAIAERMKFIAILAFVALWMVVVYFPLAHMVWGVDGLMNGVWNGDAKIKAIDFAGGTVVHMSSGWSALILCLMLGKRKGFGSTVMAPHSMTLCAVGTGMLWVGWYGFNAGSAVAADGIAANAFMTTTIAAAVASFVWPVIEWILRGKPSILGFCSGAVAGLVVITPAAGFVNAKGALIIGIIAGVVPYLACTFLKPALKYDDALDTFGVHAIGGTIGAIVTGVFATADVNANLTSANTYAAKNGLDKLVANGGLVGEQLKAVAVTLVLSIVATVVIGFVVKLIIGLRPTEEVEQQGLDLAEHGEEAYHG